MIVFDRKSKELTLPKSLGNVAVDVASGTTDAITRDELRETVSRANERTLAAAERYAAEQAGGAVSLANAYTDGVVAESAESTLDQAKDYTDSAITLTDYDYVLRTGANAGDVNEFLQWASQFDEDDLKKIRVFYRMRVLRYDNGNPSQGWLSVQGVDATYMHNNRIYVSRLGFTANQAPSWDERAFDLDTFMTSAQTKEIAEENIVYLSGYTNYWDVGVQAVNALFNKVDAMGGQQRNTLTFQKLRVFIACDGQGAQYEFHPIYMDNNSKKIYLYWTGVTFDDIYGGRNLIRARYLTLTWNTPISQGDMVEVVVNGS